MKNIIVMAYGLVCYAVGVASLVGFILFANNHFGQLGLPVLASLDIDVDHAPLAIGAIWVNIGLLLLFALQHSIMARASFKAALTRLLPASCERSTYVLATGVVLWLLIACWQAMPQPLWQVQGDALRLAINVVYYAGWVITLLATFMLNHFHLFGLQQSFRPEDPDAGAKVFRTPAFYSVVRHPIQTGVVIAMLATPDWTVGRLLLAVGMLLYVAIGLVFEERDLIGFFGDTYRDYKQRVPALFPRWRRPG